MNGCESIEITQAAQDDLLTAYWFDEHQQAGIGAYF
jgi:autonomous glycyl radical cofactor GrcA